MQHLINFIATIYLTICSSNFLFAQVDTSLIKDTNLYVKFIDSISNSGDVTNSAFNTLIEDGVIQRDGETVGGYGIYTLTNSKNDTVFRIKYSGGVRINVIKTYYYKFNNLIFARLQLVSSKKGIGSVYDKTEYYNNEGKIIKETIQKERKANNYSTEINLPLFQDGMKFLHDYSKNYNYRQN